VRQTAHLLAGDPKHHLLAFFFSPTLCHLQQKQILFLVVTQCDFIHPEKRVHWQDQLHLCLVIIPARFFILCLIAFYSINYPDRANGDHLDLNLLDQEGNEVICITALQEESPLTWRADGVDPQNCGRLENVLMIIHP